MKKIVVMFLFCVVFINKVGASKIEITDIECIDGDTIRANINGNKETIRFLAIDTPETKHSTKKEDEKYAKEASEYTCNSLTDAKIVEIEYDPKSDEKDKYNRVLGWIFIDGILLQKKLISLGYAKVKYVYDDYIYLNELYEEEKFAKENKFGIWSNENDNNIKEELNDNKEKTIFDKIVDYILEKLFNLFDYLYENLKNFTKKYIKK